jgi:hypothetical protein
MPTIDEAFTAYANVSTEQQDYLAAAKAFAALVSKVSLTAFHVAGVHRRLELIDIGTTHEAFHELIAKAAVVAFEEEPRGAASLFTDNRAFYEQLKTEILAMSEATPPRKTDDENR